MNFRYLLLFLLLFSTAFADTRCDTSFTDELTIRVLDAKSRAVDGASVTVYYQYSGTFNEYHTLGPYITDNSGTIKANVRNIEQSSSKLDCDIQVNATLAGSSRQQMVVANKHPNIIDLKLDLYPVNILLRESGGSPIKDAVVSFGSQSKRTDSNGHVKFFAQKGETDFFVSYLAGKQSGTVQVDDDTSYTIIMPLYAIKIEVVDEKASPLDATISIMNKTVQVKDGIFTEPRTFGTEVDFAVTHAGVTKNYTMYPEEDPVMRVVFDLTSPTIGKPVKEETDGKVRLSIPISDEGVYPSGIDTSSILISYRLEPADETKAWSKAVTFVSKKDLFIADLPQLPPNSLVQFRVEVSDKEGNKATINGRFATSAATDKGNETNAQPPPEEQDEFPVLYVGIGILIMIFLLYLFFRLKGKRGEQQ